MLTDIDECLNSTLYNCSSPSESCSNTIGGYNCICSRGYTSIDGLCTGNSAHSCLIYLFVHSFIFRPVTNIALIFIIIIIFVHSFIQTISVAPLQMHHYSEALSTQHGYCVGVSLWSLKEN